MEGKRVINTRRTYGNDRKGDIKWNKSQSKNKIFNAAPQLQHAYNLQHGSFLLLSIPQWSSASVKFTDSNQNRKTCRYRKLPKDTHREKTGDILICAHSASKNKANESPGNWISQKMINGFSVEKRNRIKRTNWNWISIEAQSLQELRRQRTRRKENSMYVFNKQRQQNETTIKRRTTTSFIHANSFLIYIYFFSRLPHVIPIWKREKRKINILLCDPIGWNKKSPKTLNIERTVRKHKRLRRIYLYWMRNRDIETSKSIV